MTPTLDLIVTKEANGYLILLLGVPDKGPVALKWEWLGRDTAIEWAVLQGQNPTDPTIVSALENFK